MTTLELIKMTLRKLDRPTDNDTVALYKERLLGYLNEAMLDLTAEAPSCSPGWGTGRWRSPTGISPISWQS